MRYAFMFAAMLAACSAESATSGTSVEANSASGPPTPVKTLAPASNSANIAQPARVELVGTRDQQIAQVLVRILAMSGPGEWDAARAAFLGARWGNIASLPPGDGGGSQRQDGTIRLGGVPYDISLSGTPEGLHWISFSAAVEQSRENVLRELGRLGVTWRRVGCLGHVNYREHVQLTAGGKTARLVMHEVISMGAGSVHGEAEPNGAFEISFTTPAEQITAEESEQYCRY